MLEKASHQSLTLHWSVYPPFKNSDTGLLDCIFESIRIDTDPVFESLEHV